MNALDILSKRLVPEPAAMIVRHAERFPICGGDAYWTTGLTDAGLAQARAFGDSLAPLIESCRLFYSPVKRCQQTAEGISAALAESGRKVISVLPEPQLGVFYIRTGVLEGFKEADRHGDNFIRAWFDGKVPSEIFLPLAESMDMQLRYLHSTLAYSPSMGHLDIHITHDWNINVLREGIFRIRHEDSGWPGFLSGMVFSRNENGLTAYVHDGGRMLTAAIPL